jgi:hypothetical protein
LQKLLVRILKSFAVFTVAVVDHVQLDVFVIANRSKNAQKVAVKSKQVGIVESLYALVINLAVGPVTKFAFDRDIKIVMWNPELNARDPAVCNHLNQLKNTRMIVFASISFESFGGPRAFFVHNRFPVVGKVFPLVNLFDESRENKCLRRAILFIATVLDTNWGASRVSIQPTPSISVWSPE